MKCKGFGNNGTWSSLACLLVIVVACTGCPSLVPGLAERYPVVDTGQRLSYDDSGDVADPAPGDRFYGQDAQHDGLQPAYRDNGDGTVSDLNTGLMWQQTPNLNKSTFAEAVAGAAGFSLAGHNDWRLPSIKELYSLIDFSGSTGMSAATSTPYIDTTYFGFAYGDESTGERFIDAQYCSSTQYVWTTMNGDATVFGVNFADGRIKGYGIQMPDGSAKKFFVQHVRGNSGYGVNDFSNNGDGTVTDRATGLMWPKADSGEGMDWEDALAWVQQKNGENYLGHDDWRLPNAKELQSIVDYTRAPAATNSAAIAPVFDATMIVDEGGLANCPWYWTSTTHLDGPPDSLGASAVYIAFGEALGYMETPPFSGNYQLLDVHGAGAQRSDPKVGDPGNWPYGRGPQGDVIRIYNYVRCVRDGSQRGMQSPPPDDGGGPPDGGGGPPPDGGGEPPTFDDLDTNGDGYLSLDEALAIPHMNEQLFNELDEDGDGYLSEDELPPPPDGGGGPPDGGGEPPTFDDLDTNGDGYLSLDEALAIPHMNEQLFNELDEDGDGYLSEDELPPPPDGGGGPPDGGGEPPTFDDLDTNGDGYLSLDEALAIPHMNEQLFNELDVNGDGYLSEDELPPPPDGGGGPPPNGGGGPPPPQ